MAGRRLSPEERELWQALTRTVRPLRRAVPKPVPVPSADESVQPMPVVPMRVRGRVPPARRVDPPAPPRPAPVPVLDSSWEKKIRSGRLMPDISVDLHGLNLTAAHLRLDRLLGDAVIHGWRVLLIVTGKPRATRPLPGESGKRGAIRAEIGDWLAQSRHASRIASVRAAHPRHGGEGALYIILRRPEGE
ncbi:MAG: Smr/MutS family protein [Sphingobium sp.]|nr:Smr/MutS family protein [Sphingobium sp.]